MSRSVISGHRIALTKGGLKEPVVMVESDAGFDELNSRHDLVKHNPKGFEWGYSGSGPAQLALAILAYTLEDDKRALAHYQRFKSEIIQNLDSAWELGEGTIQAWVDRVEHEDG